MSETERTLPAHFSRMGGAAARIQEAAREAGIDRDTPLGLWVQAMAACMTSFGESVVEQRHAVASSLRDGRAVVEAELQQVRDTEKLARTAIAEAQQARIVTELEKAQVIRQMTGTVAVGVVDLVRELVPSRLRRQERREAGKSFVQLMLAALCLLGVGYALRMWQAPDGSALLWRCEQNWGQDAKGIRYCPEHVLLGILPTALPALPPPAPAR